MEFKSLMQLTQFSEQIGKLIPMLLECQGDIEKFIDEKTSEMLEELDEKDVKEKEY